jgi:hypothetical protein
MAAQRLKSHRQELLRSMPSSGRPVTDRPQSKAWQSAATVPSLAYPAAHGLKPCSTVFIGGTDDGALHTAGVSVAVECSTVPHQAADRVL